MRRCVQKQDELSSKQMPKKKGNVQEEKKSKRGRKQKPFHILSGDRQRKMLCQVEKLIDLLSRKDKQSFVWMLFLRVFGDWAKYIYIYINSKKMWNFFEKTTSSI